MNAKANCAPRNTAAHAERPEAWRDVDAALYCWVLDHGGDASTASAAAWLSLADGQGHSALNLRAPSHEAMAAWSPAQIEHLARSPWVRAPAPDSTHAAPRMPARPFVLDGEHFYLTRNHRAETAVAEALRQRRATASPVATALPLAELDRLFQHANHPAEERQRAAVRHAPGHRLLVLTGGPGTGKTTTVLRMLLSLSRNWLGEHGAPAHIAACAPTGKAAQRLGQALRDEAERLHAGMENDGQSWTTHLHAALANPAATVHRLLGSRGRQGGFRFNARERLPCDIVVVDEASMLDLDLLRALLAALRDDAVLVLVGDADQLTSVGTGSVLMDIVKAMEADTRGDLTRLEHCFRADRALIPLHTAVRTGDAQAFAHAMESAGADGRTRRRTVGDERALRHALDLWAEHLRHALCNEALDITEAVAFDDHAALRARLAALQRQQLLCALREGPFGADPIAAALAQRLRHWSALARWEGQPWYPGRCVMVTRNDATAQLFNGDIGLCVRVHDGRGEPTLRVAFQATPEAAQAGHAARLFDPNTLPPHQDAYALTIHKSQGSEYAHVAVLLPPDPQSPLLNRQTLYTGLSRAKHSLELWATDAALERALGHVLQRHGRLAERMATDGHPCHVEGMSG